MIKVAKITQEKAVSLIGKEYAPFSYFNPFEKDNEWYISEKEAEFLDANEYEITEIILSSEDEQLG